MESSLIPEALTRDGGHQTEFKFPDTCVGKLAAEVFSVFLPTSPTP